MNDVEELKEQILNLQEKMKEIYNLMLRRDNALRDNLIKIEQDIYFLQQEVKRLKKEGMAKKYDNDKE